MREIKTLGDLKERLQAGFENNEESLELFGKTYSTQLKAYLIESNLRLTDAGCPEGKWRKLDDSVGWYGNIDGDLSNTLFLDSTRDRVWIIYSLMDATESDFFIGKWLERKGLDRCWLSRNHLLHWEKKESWSQRGLGLKFSDGLAQDEENAANFSLKAYYGANRLIKGLDRVLNEAREEFAIYSARWQKRTKGEVVLSSEWYSNGKATINRALDVGPDFAYLTVPGKGCINAAPRIATLQGEDNAGKTSIYHDGVEVFA